jgi:hypothetical protein
MKQRGNESDRIDATEATYDAAQAQRLVGKYVLVGLTFLNDDDELDEYRQVHGDVIRVDPQEGVVLRLRPSGQEFWLPPYTSTFEEAELGGYELRSTGELIYNPDYLTHWTLKPPADWSKPGDDGQL